MLTASRAAIAGTLTFVFTDIEGSTDLWERAPDEMTVALARHDAVVRSVIENGGGRVFSTGGDGVAAVFGSAADAVRVAVTVQERLRAETWPTPAPLRVRIGIHTGEAEQRDGDFFGPTLNRCARLMSIAHGGQVVCSAATASLLDGSSPAPLVDLGQHRLRDLSAPFAVFQVGDGSFPALRSLDSVPSNLPTMLTELVGRHDDVVSLVGTVRLHRLVTLTGVGGVGKTRMALAVGGAVAPDFVDGCWLVELAPLADGADVVRTVCAALGASSVAGDRSALLRYLEHRRVLVVLDNCEHVLDAVADLVDATLAAAPDVHVVTTSREPLGVDGEIVRRVRSLDGTRAVDLFVDRARAADETFVVTDDSADAVAEICTHLDGIPLAIELAAARVSAMSPREIARRLDDRFRMLTGGRRAQERHRTLQAAVGWSYDLLAAEDRRVFARLSVFPATFDLPAGLAVGDTDDVDVIVRLVQRSLVVHDQASGRYRLLETLRQYGADRLAEFGASDATRERYASHYAELVTRHARAAEDERHDEVVPVLLAEVDNLRATADWYVRGGRLAALRRMLLDGGIFFPQFTPAECALWLDAALADVVASPVEQVRLLGLAALNAVDIQDFQSAAAYVAASAELAAAHGVRDSAWSQSARFHIAAFGGGDPGDSAVAMEAIEAIEAMLEIADAEGDDYAATHALAQGVDALFLVGRQDEVDAWIERALARADGLQNASAAAVAVMCASSVLMARDGPGDVERARELLLSRRAHVAREFGGIIVAWLLAFRAIAVTDDPVDAVRSALDATRFADRAGSPLALVCAVSALVAPCAELRLGDEAVALAAYVADNAELLDTQLWRTHYDRVLGEALASLGVPTDGERPPAPANRKELFEVLSAIERATA